MEDHEARCDHAGRQERERAECRGRDREEKRGHKLESARKGDRRWWIVSGMGRGTGCNGRVPGCVDERPARGNEI